VAVSTCYVAGNRRGSAPEAPVDASPFWLADLDWSAEVRASRRIRADADAESRSTERLHGFRADAHKELGAAGTPLLAAKTEQRRLAWVKAQMVEAGRERAFSLGWPDAYAYTKALSEQALAQNRGNVPVSVVRPSIIESAWAEPRPGWIRGFRMAEPVIISYAQGLLKEFPGVPEGIVDVIPVDLVVATICAVAAKGPEPELPHPAVYQIASGSANPLGYQHLVDLVQEWFSANPLYDKAGQPIVVPEWSFPGRGRVQGQLDRSKQVLDRADQLLVQAQRPADDLRVASPDLETTVEGTRKVVHGITENRDAMFDFIKYWALNLNGYDGISHYWRVALALNSDTWTGLIDTILKGPGGLNLGLQSPTQTGTTADKSSEAESTSEDAKDAPAGAVGNLLKPLTGLTKGLTGGSLLQKKQSEDGSSTGLDKKQESSLLGFLLGGGK
jgi:hypothetical protein